MHTERFIIERSKDRRNYTAVGEVPAAGSPFSVLHYQYTAPAPENGISYCRLKIVDEDGSFSHSAIDVVNMNSKETMVLLYPVPARDVTKLLIASPRRQEVEYSIVDITGRELKKGNLRLESGSNQFELNLSNLPNGSYPLRVLSPLTTTSLQFVKQ